MAVLSTNRVCMCGGEGGKLIKTLEMESGSDQTSGHFRVNKAFSFGIEE